MSKYNVIVLKNYTFPSEIWPAFPAIYVQPRLISWGLVINHMLYFVENYVETDIRTDVKRVTRTYVACKSFRIADHLNLVNYSINTNLDSVITGSYHIVRTMSLILSANIYEDPRVIQIKLVESLTNVALTEDLVQQITSAELYSTYDGNFADDYTKGDQLCCTII